MLSTPIHLLDHVLTKVSFHYSVKNDLDRGNKSRGGSSCVFPLLFVSLRSHLGRCGHYQERARLYVGNLSPRVTEDMLTGIFVVAGLVQHVRIIPDHESGDSQHDGRVNCGFVEYSDMRAAETAVRDLNGRQIFDTKISVNRLYQNQQNNEDTSDHFHVLVCDLSPEVNDDALARAFSAFGTLSVARVMRDINSGKSCGFGFLSFRDKTDAERAIAAMNGKWLGSRAIHVIWVNQTTEVGPSSSSAGSAIGGGGTAHASANYQGSRGTLWFETVAQQMQYEKVVRQTPSYNTTVYVTDLDCSVQTEDLLPLFESIGDVSEIGMELDNNRFNLGYVRMDTHQDAAMAIVQLQGQKPRHYKRPMKCSWWRPL